MPGYTLQVPYHVLRLSGISLRRCTSIDLRYRVVTEKQIRRCPTMLKNFYRLLGCRLDPMILPDIGWLQPRKEWLTAEQVTQLGGSDYPAPGSDPVRWELNGSIFSIRHEGVVYYPRYVLDPSRGYRPYPQLADVITFLAPTRDGWLIASWFEAVTGLLGGQRPRDWLSTHPERVIAAAGIADKGIQHG